MLVGSNLVFFFFISSIIDSLDRNGLPPANCQSSKLKKIIQRTTQYTFLKTYHSIMLVDKKIKTDELK